MPFEDVLLVQGYPLRILFGQLFIPLRIFGTGNGSLSQNPITEIHCSLLASQVWGFYKLCCLFKTPRGYLKGDFVNKENFETYNP